MNETKIVCEECDWHGTSGELLTAPSPFDRFHTIAACPNCKEVNYYRTACDEPGCWEPDTMGTPTENGYRRTCYKHRPREES